jgi:hypothetical protein
MKLTQAPPHPPALENKVEEDHRAAHKTRATAFRSNIDVTGLPLSFFFFFFF